jgi:DNA-binding transcriptional ArsR family regulator
VPVVEDELTITFTALADPTRRAILRRLALGDATVGELAEPFTLTQQAVSKHLKVLERAGLVSRLRAAQARPCHLEMHNLAPVLDWITEQRRIWEQRHDRLEQHLAKLAGDDDPDGR